MKLFEEVEAPASEMNLLGTVTSNIGATGRIDFSPTNLLKDDVLVLVDLTNSEGKKQTVHCSAALSAQIRKDKMKQQDLINYVGGLQVAITTNKAGEERFKIVLDQGARVGGSVTAAPVAKKTEFADMPW